MFCTIGFCGGTAQVKDKFALVNAENAVNLLIKRVDVKTGNACGQERSGHHHQGRDEQEHNQHQFFVQTSKHRFITPVQTFQDGSGHFETVLSL